ncbi:hypothetical protein [Escherichia coli]|uniref:hypothetical protein n=1 Tax=Escherichia coli TaxID=562 RepID=UPI003513A89D
MTARFQTLLPGVWNAANRGETAVISLRADNADLAIARITDLMCESLLGYKGQRAYRAGENEQGRVMNMRGILFVLLLGGPEQKRAAAGQSC